MPAPTELEAEINARLAAGERLLASASMIGHRDEHRLWQTSREMWAQATVARLAGHVNEQAIRTFGRAAAPPPTEGSVAEDLPLELEAVRNGMAVLVGLRSAIAAQPAADRPSRERRGARLGP